VKTLKVAALISLIAVICVSIGAVSAFSASDATVSITLTNNAPAAGTQLAVSVTFQSHTSTTIQVVGVGFHGDWMDEDNFQGPNLSSNPQTVAANSVYTAPFMVTIPSDVSIGSHKYFATVRGQDTSGNTYYWDSSEGTMQVVPYSATTVTPTPTVASSQNGGQPLSTMDYIVYIAIVAIVAMIILALMVLLTLKKRSRAKTAPQPTSSPPSQSPAPEQQPPEETPSSGENFDI
jgi:hypothetical protein